MIEQKGNKYVLYTTDKSRVLGTHDSYESAIKQEQAIAISKANKPSIKQKLTSAVAEKTLEKIAITRSAKEYLKLSKKYQDMLIKSLPAGKTMSVAKTPLGQGAEGKVFPSVTGQKGESAVKVFFDEPATHGVSGEISKGAKGIKRVLGDVPFQERARVMRAYPNLFPEVHGLHGRGFVTERLKPYAPENKFFRFLSNIRAQLFGDSKTEALAKSIRSTSGINTSSNDILTNNATVPLDAYFLKDFYVNPSSGYAHNVMRTQSGRPVISDPVLIPGRQSK